MNLKFWETLRLSPEGEGAGEAETPVAGTEGTVEGEDASPSGEEGGGLESPAPSSPEPVEPPKAQRGLLNRISQLTREKRELEETLAAQQQRAEEEVAPGQLTPEMVQRELHRRAMLLAQQNEWAKTADELMANGVSKYPDFQLEINKMAMILGEIPRALTEAAIETGAPVDVLYHLAKNPDEAAKIALLPPARMGAAVAKLHGTLGPKVSNAPAPITPKVGGGAVSAQPSIYDEKLSMADWAKARMAQKAAARR